MKNLLVLCSFLFFTGCASVGDVVTSKEVFVACRAADIATTKIAMAEGAYEMSSFPFPILVVLNIVVSIWAWHTWDQIDTAGKAIANTISCLPVVNNVNVINQMKAAQ